MGIDEGRIRRLVLAGVAAAGEGSFLPVGVSARHVHLSEADFKALFGENEQLHKEKDISQPGQFAAKEKVTVKGRKASLENVRVLGPFRKETQVEISLSDAFALGEKDTPIRLSGDLSGTPGITLIGPAGSIQINAGLIVAKRHAHFSAEQAKAFGVHDGQKVSVRIEGRRPGILEDVVCRVGSGHELELHIDTDEANAFCLANGSLAELIVPGTGRMVMPEAPSPEAKKALSPPAEKNRLQSGPEGPAVPAKPPWEGKEIFDLLTEQEVRAAFKGNEKKVYCSKKAVITPAARDAAAACEVEIVRILEVETKKWKIE